MRAIFNTSFIIFLLFIITGCQKKEIVCSKPSSTTLIVYMGGDNNLSREVVEKISAIQFFARSNPDIKNGKVNILIYRDVLNHSPQLYQCSYGSTEAVLLTTYGQQNSASSDVFSRVLADCKHYAPADSYGLLVFSHASGWLPDGALSDPNRYDTRSVILDGTNEMDIKDFAAAIPDGMFDYIVFEACFMAGIEVAYELKDKADYIMASSAEILSPGFTNIYQEILSHMLSGVDTEVSLIGAADAYFNHFTNKSGFAQSATVSVITTRCLEEIAEQVKALQPYNALVNIEDIQHFDRNGNLYHLFFDLEDYVSKATSSSLSRSIENTVIYRRATSEFLMPYNGFTINNHCGLTTYVVQERFPSLNHEYTKLKWHQAIN